MGVLAHGSDIALAPTVSCLVWQRRRNIADALDRVAAMGFRSVQLDATLSGIRPRELNRRARKDLLAWLSRRDLRLAGLDFFIPRQHYVEIEHIDRAMNATTAALELAADLGKVPLSVALPIEKLGQSERAALAEAADRYDVPLAVHAEDQLDALVSWIRDVDLPVVGCGIDPASVLANGGNPIRLVQDPGMQWLVARLSDARIDASAQRCDVGDGDLDVVNYRVALDLSVDRVGPVVLDLRSLNDAMGSATHADEMWSNAAFSI